MGKLRNGIIVTIISKYLYIIIMFVVTMILSRVLSPKDFGIVAVLTVFTNFFLVIGDMGIGAAIIQKKDLSDRDISNIFFIMIILGLLFGIFFVGITELIVLIYNDTVYRLIGRLLTFSVVFSIWNIIPQAVLQKEKKFKLIGLITIFSTLLSGAIAIISALSNVGYFSIVYQSIFYAMLLFNINLYYSKVKFKLEFNAKPLNKIKEYSIYQMLFNLINYFARNLDSFLIGKTIGEAALGYYNMAYKLVLMPVQYLTNAVTPVLHPVLSDYQNNYSMIYKQFLKVVRVLALLGGFISIVCFSCATEIITVLYGSQWNESIVPFKIMSLSIGFQMIMSASGSIFQASGNTKYLFLSGLASSTLIISGIVFGIQKNEIVYVSIGITIAYIINFFQTFYVLIKVVLKQSLREFIVVIRWTVISAFITYIASGNFRLSGTPLFTLVFKIALIGLIYLGILLISGELKRVINILVPQKRPENMVKQ
ncbi:lipopolysaccharide biosynthesis protein [Paenibacillus sonchi]|nr:lipopolysaccharide biosynthesis protein [Paenibacillus sonchi]